MAINMSEAEVAVKGSRASIKLGVGALHTTHFPIHTLTRTYHELLIFHPILTQVSRELQRPLHGP